MWGKHRLEPWIEIKLPEYAALCAPKIANICNGKEKILLQHF